MISVSVTSNTSETLAFLVEVKGSLVNRSALNEALGKRLALELQTYFRSRSSEPNKMAAPSLGFWNKVAADTQLNEVSDTGATVAIASPEFRPRLFGAVIKPTGGRKFLTIPLVAAAYGKRAQEYELASGHKLFRLGNSRVLAERVDSGGTEAGGQVTLRRSRSNIVGQGYQKINIREKSQIRAVFALCPSVTIPKDPRALPASDFLLTALSDTADQWAARQNRKAPAA
ncbi:MAG: hypothetical protein DUW69_001562 [Verrucomicrobia bacterium]|nr:MAG: hypothetical protein DUW69_001562 [Verrucomicrobiota bacterium]